MYSEDPGAGFHGWVSNQAEPISNDAVSVFLLFSCLISIGFSSQFCFVCVNFGFF
jgi:hypothetical protein